MIDPSFRSGDKIVFWVKKSKSPVILKKRPSEIKMGIDSIFLCNFVLTWIFFQFYESI